MALRIKGHVNEPPLEAFQVSLATGVEPLVFSDIIYHVSIANQILVCPSLCVRLKRSCALKFHHRMLNTNRIVVF